MYDLLIFSISIVAGILGAILGIGGGIIVIPVLTLGFQVDIRYAIAASLISIVATSSGAAASFLRDHLTNLRVAVFLEIGTVFGAITGFLLSMYVHSNVLFLLFGFFLLFSAAMMLKKRKDVVQSFDDHPWSKRLHLASSYPDQNGNSVSYNVANVPWGLLLMYGAGVMSALLGIGSGILKVMAMDGVMRLPIKVSSATSNFMIGVTATASAGAFLINGSVQPEIAAPVATGILVGSFMGAKIMIALKPDSIRKLFVVVLSIVACQMIYKGLHG
jgi:uncharacterized protein